jgi:hypothetical protein
MSLAEIWLPILLSGVFVFVVSSIVHMVLPHHRQDYKKLPNEDAALAGLRGANVPPGDYMFPACGSMKEMGSPEMLARYRSGPVGVMTLLPNQPPSMGKALFLWFLYTLVISTFAGYVGTLAVYVGAPYDQVFRVTGTVAILGYAFSNVMNSIWKGQSWGTTFKFVIDGVVYGLVTAGTFGWLWPDAV